MPDADTARLIADIGSTFARFALETAPGRFELRASLRCADHAQFQDAVRSYLDTLPVGRIPHAAVAIANPVEGDEVRMTNYHWRFSIEATRQLLAFDTLVVVNDFTALAMGVPRLGGHERRQVGGGEARPHSTIGVLGAGSGLGVSGLIPTGDGWVALGGEGGHISFAPRDEVELAVLAHARQRFEHVSFERLVSGPGLELVHEALSIRAGQLVQPLPAPEISRRALAGEDAACAATIEVFCRLLGTVASDLAVTLGARGGLYIGGSLVPRLGALFDRSGFRQRFEDKGRFGAWLRAIPTYVITAETATMVGASAILEAQLRELGGGSPSPVLAQIRRGLDTLSPAERRVADHVLSHPRAALNAPIAEIAREAGVSQPTVIRFCRSLGCEGLSDFKLRLAAGLTGTVPVTHARVTDDDSPAELGAKVLGNTASAVLQLREQLNRDAIERVIEVLAGARRIECHAAGQYGVVALDAQFKFLRLGLACSAQTDPRLQRLSAAVLGPGDVALIISSSGQVDGLIEVADIARERGATVVAISAGQSPLMRRADHPLVVDHAEDPVLKLPMVGRVLHLLVIDILAVGLAMRQRGATAGSPDDEPAASETAPAAADPAAGPVRRRRLPPGVAATAGSLSHITSHSS